MSRNESLLNISIETVADCVEQLDGILHTREYKRGMKNHMKRYQPHIAQMVSAEYKPDAIKNAYFRAGSFSTYDLIVSADPTFWEKNKVNKDAIKTTKEKFKDASIRTSTGDVMIRDRRIVTDVRDIYVQLATDSPTYAQWLQEQVDQIDGHPQVNEFIYGSILTAMPFYITRENERFARIFDF